MSNDNWRTGTLFSLVPTLGPREKNKNEGGKPGYFSEGFLHVQKSIDYAFIKYLTNIDVDSIIDLNFKRYPYPPYQDDNFIVVVIAFLPFVTLISFIFTSILTAKAIVHEKETGMKEAMKLMGMKTWIYWLSWYIRSLLLLIPGIIMMTISFKVKLDLNSGGKAAIINKTDAFIFILVLLLYASSTTTFTFLSTCFFKKANAAAAGAGVLQFLTYLPFVFFSIKYDKLGFAEKVASSFINNVCMGYGIQMIGMFEAKGVGVNFNNWTKGITLQDTYSMGHVMLIMFFNNFIHLILMYYFENVLPGDHGIAKPWYFPISFLLRRHRKKVFTDIELKSSNIKELNDTFVEDESIYSSYKIGIKIENINKSFKQLGVIKQAVKDLSLNIYEGQISVLLGANGAGKSTTISMITGLCEPNQGNITINNIDIVKNTKNARKYLGYCPQHNLLFDNLTVYEHLKFFSKLKENFNDKEIDQMLDIINLSDKKHALSKNLSGGMKRKLSVAIAFIGNSKIVILDEPSSGMDPQARHSTWSLLQKFKKENNTTILLTTHFMDEADFLGDRIAIMSKGSLKCCGSPLYLKSKFGSGYNLTISKKKQQDDSIKELKQPDQTDRQSNRNDFISNEIIKIVKNFIPNSKLHSNINSEISFILPSSDSNKFSGLFECLEREKENLNIVNVGVSVTTIEDVFLKTAEENEIQDSDINSLKETYSNKDNDKSNNDDDTYGLWIGSKSSEVNVGFILLLQQLQILIFKRIIHTLRNKLLILVQLIIPIAFLVINLLIIKYGPIKNEELPALEISLSTYENTFVPYLQIEKNDNSLNKLVNAYSFQLSKTKKIKQINLENKNSLVDSLCESSRNGVEEYLICLCEYSHLYLLDKSVVGATFEKIGQKLNFIGHFNNQPLHVPPLALNLFTNSILRSLTNNSNYNIRTYNYPLPRNTNEFAKNIMNDSTSFNIASGLTFGFAFLLSSFAVFLIKERVSGSKHLQFMNGSNRIIFWISTLTWDLINYLIPVAAVLVVLKIFDISEFINESRWTYLLLLMIVYGFANIPQVYILSYMFKISATGFALISGWNILTSQITLIVFGIIVQQDLKDAEEYLNWIFILLFPNFSLGQGMIDMYDNSKITSYCEKLELVCSVIKNPCCKYKNQGKDNPCGAGNCLDWNRDFLIWDRPGLSKYLLFMAIQFVIQFGFLLLLDIGYFRLISYKLKSLFGFKNEISTNISKDQLEIEEQFGDIKKDSDVIDEENRIQNLTKHSLSNLNQNEIFIVDRLTKYYSNFMAVKGISFSVKKSESFGLLGTNGAGKTTTFKMITGDETITKGDAFLNRINIKDNIRLFQKQLGYCPQFDPLIDQMTVYETMELFANLRGIKPRYIRKTCLSLISLLDLNDHVKKMCYTLSGGNKRKLSVALALVGSPVVILLDEPTSGMDPKTRRILWDCLNKIRNKGKSLILTTHSMDETEALCSNIGIMVNGELKCLGSLQNLKSRYGEGYTLLSKIALIKNDREKQTKEINEFILFIKDNFSESNCKLKENRNGFINIHINDNTTTCLSKIFSLVEQNKSKYSIEYYVVTQTKLEQIFLNFASKQIDPETRMIINKRFLCC